MLKWIEEILMNLKPSIFGENEIYIPQMCGPQPYFRGLTDETIRQGTTFDLLDGVHAYDADGNEIPFDVSPSEVVSCQLGDQVFTYSAEGITKERTITVIAIPNPIISGISEKITVETGAEFDPMDGVSAVDGNGNTVTVTVVLEP